MKLRNRLFVAQLPLALALVGITAFAVVRGELHTRGEWFVLLGALVALAAGLLASLRLTTVLLRPLGVLAAAARRLGQGDLAVRARVPNQDELGELAKDFNTMAERIDGLQHTGSPRRAEDLGDELAATLAHELKTPLTSLRMALHLLAEGAAGALVGKQLDLVVASREDCERLQALVVEVLEARRLQTGALELQLQATTPAALVAASFEAQRSMAQARGVTLIAELLPSAASVRCDPDRIQIVLANLVANAVRHTPEGGHVTVGCRAVQGSSVRFTVEDGGPGIAPEYHARIFERFFRVPGSGSRGTGLGLWIVREIVLAHGGTVGVESEPGQGSRFWFALSQD